MMDKQVLSKWLKVGYLEKEVFYHTQEGVPQGGIISPTLMLLTLRGLEAVVKQSAPKKPDKVNTVVYADDFIITADSKEILENKVNQPSKLFLRCGVLSYRRRKPRSPTFMMDSTFLALMFENITAHC